MRDPNHKENRIRDGLVTSGGHGVGCMRSQADGADSRELGKGTRCKDVIAVLKDAIADLQDAIAPMKDAVTVLKDASRELVKGISCIQGW